MRCGPAQIGLQLELLAQQHRRQEQRQLQAVLLRRREQAHRPVEVQGVALRPDALDLAEQPVELDGPEQLPVARRRLVLDGDVDADGAE